MNQQAVRMMMETLGQGLLYAAHSGANAIIEKYNLPKEEASKLFAEAYSKFLEEQNKILEELAKTKQKTDEPSQ